MKVNCCGRRACDAEIAIREQRDVTFNLTQCERTLQGFYYLFFISRRSCNFIERRIAASQDGPRATIEVPQQRALPFAPYAGSDSVQVRVGQEQQHVERVE